MKTYNKKQYTSAQSVAGATILEVMISVLLLTFGILALMAAQIRSVASVSDAANRTLISQAAEALSEGMMANPTQARTRSGGAGPAATNYGPWLRSYGHYIRPATTVGTPGSTATVSPTNPLAGSLTPAALATLQLNNFAAALENIPDIHNIAYIVCNDTSGSQPSSMTDFRCNGNTAEVYIKVVWETGSQTAADERNIHSFIYKAGTN